jgi:hypothetical protein
MKMYIYVTNTDKDCDLLQDLSSLQGGRPMTNKTAAILTTAKIWSLVPEGLNVKTDGRTDWLTDWLTDSLPHRRVQEPG